MLIYHYHPQTKEYLGFDEADESPLEPGVFLIPANATKIEPITPSEGFTAVWNDSQWIEVEDNRGLIVYEKSSGNQKWIEELGPIPEEYTLLIPNTSRDTWDGSQWITPPPEPVLLSKDKFVERFRDDEKATIMHTPELTPLALKVLTAPNGVDVTDETSQAAKAALVNLGFTEERLNEIFRLPE